MVARRLEPSASNSPVTLHVDGKAIRARANEPVAAALVADDRLLFGRSVKYHRPRGPVCFAGACDGCLMRVDGVPNVMTCQLSARDGMVIETQNVLGSAQTDLLSATDWFFPGGLDHHHMFTQFRAVNQVMQKVARRIAGIGRLPGKGLERTSLRELESDVFVVGAGPAGLAAARECASRGLRTWVADTEIEPGGHLCYLPGSVDAGEVGSGDPRAIASRMAKAATDAGAELLLGHRVVGVYTDPPEPLVAVASETGVTRVRCKALLIATGAQESGVALPGADLPAVFGTRGFARLLQFGVLPGRAVVVAGNGDWSTRLVEVLGQFGATVDGPHPMHSIVAFSGRQRVRSVEVKEADGKTRRVRCDVAAVESPVTGVFQLGGQAGARVVFDHGAFVLEASMEGRTAVPWVFAAGECTGTSALTESIGHGREAGRTILGQRP